MQDIVGARFHCALCDNIDICSNCESAGLPGNLTAPDGGHDSSHIMIKVSILFLSTVMCLGESLYFEDSYPSGDEGVTQRQSSSTRISGWKGWISYRRYASPGKFHRLQLPANGYWVPELWDFEGWG